MINTKIIYKPRGAHDSESRGGVQGYNTSVSVGADKCNWAQRAGVADVAKVAEKATTSSMADAAHSLTEDAQSVQDARYISKLHADEIRRAHV